MPCFYCGKRVSLVRQMSDADFCSDEHRKRYHALTRLAFNRLLDASQQRATSVPRPDPEPLPAPHTFEEAAPPASPPPEPQHAPARPKKRVRHEHEPEFSMPAAKPEPEPVFAPGQQAVPPHAPFFAARLVEPAVAAADVTITELAAHPPVLPEDEHRIVAASMPGMVATPPRGNGFTPGAPHPTGRSSAEVTLAAIAQQLPPRPLILQQPRGLSSPAGPAVSDIGRGRSAPRPALRRVPAAYVRIAGLDRAGLIYRAQPARDRKFASRLAIAEFLAFRTELRTGIQCPLHMAHMPASAGYLGRLAPGASTLRSRSRELPAFAIRGVVHLPAYAFEPVEQAAGATAPQRTDPWMVVQTRPATLVSTRRLCTPPEFRARDAWLPRLSLKAATRSAPPGAGLDFLGYPPATRPTPARPVARRIQMAFHAAEEVLLPRLAAERATQVITRQCSWIACAAPAPKKPARPSHDRASLPFAAGGGCFPAEPGIATLNCVLAQAPLQPHRGARPVASKAPRPAALAAQFARPAALVELPESGLRAQAPDARLVPAPPFGLEEPAGRAGSKVVRAAMFGFHPMPAPIPALSAAAAAAVLRPAGPSIDVPRPLTRPAASARTSGPAPIRVTATVRLAVLPSSLRPSPGALTERPLREVPLPTARTLAATARRASEAAMAFGALLPAPPAHIGGPHAVPRPGHVECGLKATCAQLPKWKAEASTFAVNTASLPSRRLATPLALASPPELALSGTAVRGSFTTLACPSQPPAAAPVSLVPAIAALRTGKLGSAQVEAGGYLVPVRKAPAAAQAKDAGLAFAGPPALLPPERTMRAREALEFGPVIAVPARPLKGAAVEPRAIAVGIAPQRTVLPDFEISGKPEDNGRGRRLGAPSFEHAPAPASRGVQSYRGARAASVPISLTTPLAKINVSLAPPRAFLPAAAGLGRAPEAQASRIPSPPRPADGIGFAVRGPQPPAAAIAARCKLGDGAPLPSAGRTAAGSPRPAATAVVPVSTHAVQVPGAVPLKKHALAAAPAIAGAGRALGAMSPHHAAEWVAFRENAPGFESVETRARRACWPESSSVSFLREPGHAPRAGMAGKVDPNAAAAFAASAVRHPQSAAHKLGLAELNAAKLRVPAAREDSRTANTKGRLTPAFRLSSRPSRLPVFRTTVEKAHMPFGVFSYLETDDRDDERTSALGPAHPAVMLQPATPEPDFLAHARETLGSAPLMPLSAGPYAAVAEAAPGFGDFPYDPELFFVNTGINLLGMDFEAIVEAYEPRWRSALKTASGLFRGVMIFIPGIVILSGMLAGCSASGGSLRGGIQSRAAIRVEHDFSTGLDGWYGGRDWARNWIREPGSGFVRAGQLALYRPSQPLTNYRLEFLGQIDGESIGWVYRAADLQNYYAAKLVVTKPGPSPVMALVRYQVVAGQETQRVQIPVRMLLHNGRPYRIQQDVEGQGFTTSIEDEVVDFWTDDRLRTGGVGFFGAKNDTPHLYWMKVTHYDDFWGKLCATIAPNN